MAGKGGYQMPDKPAQVSAPGSGARTDGGPASKQAIQKITGFDPNVVNTNQDFTDLQQAAPVAATPDAKAMPQSQISQAIASGQPLPKLSDPSQRPWEHVTTPAPAPAVIDPRLAENATLVQRYLPDLQAGTNIPGAPDSYRKFVNFLAQQVQAMPE